MNLHRFCVDACILITLRGHLVLRTRCSIASNDSAQLLGGSCYEETLLVIYPYLADTVTHHV